MPKAARTRVIAAPAERVWDLVADPHHLPRWWPRTVRVEDVHEGSDGLARWTSVMQTERGAPVRADYRCVDAEPAERYAWEQDVEGTPFEGILRSSALELSLRAAGERTTVTLASDETLRGLSRLGSTIVRGAARKRLDEALDGIERAVVEPG